MPSGVHTEKMLEIESSIFVIILLIWLLHFVLTKVFFNPVRKVIEKRESQLRENKASGDRALEESEQRIKEIDESLRAARTSAHQVRNKFEKEALNEKNRLVEEIHQETRKQVEKAQKRLEKQIKDSKKKLASEAETLAERIEQKILFS